MDSSLFVFGEDLRGEGIATVLDRAMDGYGVRGVTVAAAYHRARDVTPHGPDRVTVRGDGVHFKPAADLFDQVRLAPPVIAADGMIEELRRAAENRRAALRGWAVFCHNSTLGERDPGITLENSFGDRGSPGDLCPAHPDVRAYCVALARAVARLGVTDVVAESLGFGGFGHGYHHERCFVELGPMDAFLFGLCFCRWCMESAAGLGVDVDAARSDCAEVMGRLLDGGGPAGGPVTKAALTAYAGPAVVAYALARAETVTSLVSDVAAAVAEEGARLTYLDMTGAAKGYADGLPQGGPAALDSWQLGVDLRALSDIVDGVEFLAYARDPARVADDVRAYRRAVDHGCAVRAVLRPGPPDTGSAEDLAAKVHAAASAGADAADFYCYGLYPLPVLDRIPAALAGV